MAPADLGTSSSSPIGRTPKPHPHSATMRRTGAAWRGRPALVVAPAAAALPRGTWRIRRRRRRARACRRVRAVGVSSRTTRSSSRRQGGGAEAAARSARAASSAPRRAVSRRSRRCSMVARWAGTWSSRIDPPRSIRPWSRRKARRCRRVRSTKTPASSASSASARAVVPMRRRSTVTLHRGPSCSKNATTSAGDELAVITVGWGGAARASVTGARSTGGGWVGAELHGRCDPSVRISSRCRRRPRRRSPSIRRRWRRGARCWPARHRGRRARACDSARLARRDRGDARSVHTPASGSHSEAS